MHTKRMIPPPQPTQRGHWMFPSQHLPPHSGKQPSGMGSGLSQVAGPAGGEACRLEWHGGGGVGEVVWGRWCGAGRRIGAVSGSTRQSLPLACYSAAERILLRPSTMETQMLLAKPGFQLLFLPPKPDGWSPNIKHANFEGGHEVQGSRPKWLCQEPTHKKRCNSTPLCSAGQSHRSFSSGL